MKLALRKLLLLAFICVSLFLGQSITAASQTVKAGATCTKTGEIKKTLTQTLECTSLGKRKVWVKLDVKSTPSGKSTGSSSADNFPFQNVGIDLKNDPWQWSSAKNLGPFQPIKIFGRVYNGKFKEVALTFMMLKPGTKVYSPVNGRVLDVRPQPESCDSELYIGFDESKGLSISFDHVTAVSGLKRGDRVKVGDVIATVPKWDCNSDWGGVEFMYVHPEANTAYCPLELISPTVAPILKTSIIKVMRKWNDEVGAIPSAYQAADLERGPCEVAATSIQKS